MTETEQILSRIEAVEGSITRLVGVLDKLTSIVSQFIENNNKKTDDTLRWAQEFHRMLIDEYAAGAQGRIFAMVFVDIKSGMRRLVQIVASDMEKAYQIAREKIVSTDKGPTEWVMELVAKQVIPLDKDNKILDSVEEKMKFERPLDVYINSLLLAKERFAKTTPQKKAIDNVIETIKQTNGS